MGVHLFGAVSSTSCANFALRKAANDNLQQFDSAAINTLKRNFYVNARLKSVPGEEEAICLTDDLRKLLEKGGFNLTKWVSNSHRVIKSLHVSERVGTFKDLHDDQLPIGRALGVHWDIEHDKFCYGAVSYLRFLDDKDAIQCSFVMRKVRTTP